VDNKLADDDSKLNVELKFSDMEDFEPAQVLQQVEPLRKLFEARQKLTDLMAKLDGNDALEGLLQDVVSNTEGMEAIKSEVGSDGDGEEEGE
jgi:type VI secretion system protein ImpB